MGRGKLSGALALAILLAGGLSFARAQKVASVVGSDLELPDAPGSSITAPDAAEDSHAPAATITGTVFDSSGALVPQARVALIGKDGTGRGMVNSGSQGEFRFGNLPPGTYRISVFSPGMGGYISPDIVLGAGQTREIEHVVLAVDSARVDVLVTVTQQEIATEQVHAAIEQRVLGVLPNFYSSYDPNPVPLTTKLKFELALRSTTDPVSFLTAGVSAGLGQATNLYGGYGQGAQGYAKRYAAGFADDIIDRTVGSALLPSLLHQDPRYFYSGVGTRKTRALYAIRSAFVCKGDNGQWQFNYSHLIGNFVAAGISNAYYPAADRGAVLTLRNGLVDTAGNVAANVLREFLLKGLTPKAKDSGKGTP